jgi:hypothetical protein
VQPDSRDLRPRKILSWSSLPLQSRTASRLPALRDRRTHLRGLQRPVEPGNRLSWGSFSPRAHGRRVPLVTPTTTTRSRGPCSHSREGEGYQALTGAVLRVLAPLDGSGRARGTHVRLPSPHGDCSDAVAVAPRRFAALFHAARARWSRPTELSLPEEPYPLSRALSPLWVRADRPTARRGPRVSRPLSPVAPTSRHGSPEGSPDCEAVTKVPWSR